MTYAAFGITGRLRSEFRAAIQRCHGSDEKFQQVRDTLEVLMAWAEAKLEADNLSVVRVFRRAEAVS